MYLFEPSELVSLLGHATTVTLKNKKTIEGYLYTIDPDAHHVVLFQHPNKVMVIMHHTITDIKIDQQHNIDSSTMDALLDYDAKPSTAWIEKRRLDLMDHLHKHRVPIEWDGQVIHVLSCARVESPYVATSIVCDNALIRKRVRDMILQFD
ncbi:uncharacterized protein B0P05DRAFT_527535 [Gilbertella persicaria]|uniref:Gem (Nuclear organelle) associated protein 6 n=1 Tax=Rhizopus stolonifer TaxID=4846 RepID=A0A367KNZ3_RHIST|nr:uncharacterized protein B0P05DRAFT_527535 [Gilbertella persicaria]KAI8091439.1 hypothetical protein B0P05DRAFT_527535 [Gilbertella persicaria]RCI03562.1 Gem (Nuclear organelle) associated protein 6 [Rhizopus stolonifer]